MINIEEVLIFTKLSPKTSNEMLVGLSALALLNALIKLEDYKAILSYDMIKPSVVNLVNYSLSHPELQLLNNLYYDKSENCLYVRCLGVQFSYHNVKPIGLLYKFIESQDNIYMSYDNIRKQPKALSIFRLALECLHSNINDESYINNAINNLENDFPQLLTRKNKSVRQKNPINMENKDEIKSIFSIKYKVSNI